MYLFIYLCIYLFIHVFSISILSKFHRDQTAE